MLALLLAAPAARAADPIDHSQPPAPDGTPMCAAWVHDQYTVERGGRSWATWHPPRDPRYHCAFGHEHGSNPRAFRYFARTGMPAFGLVSDYAGSPEAHAGLQGLRGQRGPQGPRVDDGPAPGIRLAAARQRALPLARDLAVPRARPPNVGANAPDGGLRRGGGELPGRREPRAPGGSCRCPAAARPTRSGPRRSTWAASSGRGPPSASTTRSPSSTRPTRSA